MKRIQCNCRGAPLTAEVGTKICCPYCGTVFLLDEPVRTDEILSAAIPPIDDPAPHPIIDGWQCSFCDTMNSKQEEFCSKCGCARIDPTEMLEWEPPKTLSADEITKNSTSWYCTNCGTENDKDYPFCRNCGEIRYV